MAPCCRLRQRVRPDSIGEHGDARIPIADATIWSRDNPVEGPPGARWRRRDQPARLRIRLLGFRGGGGGGKLETNTIVGPVTRADACSLSFGVVARQFTAADRRAEVHACRLARRTRLGFPDALATLAVKEVRGPDDAEVNDGPKAKARVFIPTEIVQSPLADSRRLPHSGRHGRR